MNKEPQNTSTRTTNKPKRHRDNKHTTSTNNNTKQPSSTAASTSTLQMSVCISCNKVFSIKHTIDGTNTPQWYIVKVKPHNNDYETSCNEGKYTSSTQTKTHDVNTTAGR